MGLKALISTEEFEKLSAEQKGFYGKLEDDSGNYVLDADAVDRHYKAKVSEFRDTNIALMKKQKELEDKLAAFDGVDLGAVNELKAKLEEAEKKRLLDENKIDEYVEKHTANLRRDYESKLNKADENLKSATEQAQLLRKRYKDTLIKSNVAQSISNVGVLKKGALPDVMSRAFNIWDLDEEDNLVARDNGELIYGSNPPKLISMDEWAKTLVNDAPHLFEGSRGTGSQGSGRGNGQQGEFYLYKGDDEAISRNLEAIASGKVQVRSP